MPSLGTTQTSYVALKPVRFDRNYAIGEIIPGGVVDDKRASALAAMHIITEAPGGAIDAPDMDMASLNPEAAPAKTAASRKRAAAPKEE